MGVVETVSSEIDKTTMTERNRLEALYNKDAL